MDRVVQEFSPLLTETATRRLRAHPAFRDAAEVIARGAVAHFTGLDEPHRQIFRDIGEASISIVALSLQRSPTGLTAANLTSVCLEKNLSSRGRVRAYLDRCFHHGQLIQLDTAEPWTQRSLAFRPGHITAFRERGLVELEATILLEPSLAGAEAELQDDNIFLDVMMWLGVFSQARPDVLLNHSANAAMEMFVHTDGGMLMLYDLMLAQAPDRSRLMESAPLSRSLLAKRFGVSRLHVARMLEKAGEQGLMSCPSPDRIDFSPRLSEGLEVQTALLMQWLRAAILAARRTRELAKARPDTTRT